MSWDFQIQYSKLAKQQTALTEHYMEIQIFWDMMLCQWVNWLPVFQRIIVLSSTGLSSANTKSCIVTLYLNKGLAQEMKNTQSECLYFCVLQ